MARPVEGLPLDAISLLALLAALGLSLLVLDRVGDRDHLRARLTERFYLGVPWGTVVVIGWLLFVYFVVQGALFHPGTPLVIPFRSWSYFYPLGMVFAAFGHNGQAHLVGNLLTTVAFAPIAEYAWSHYAVSTDAHLLGDRLQGPRRRIPAFVAGVLGVGLLTSLFVPGPLIGFSGVVFAFGGLALVSFPLASVLAILGERLVSLFYHALTDPTSIAVAQQRFITPGWVGIAVQGHALGLLIGVVVGVVLLRRRAVAPSLPRVWFAGVVFSVSEGLFALYWLVGADRFLLFRALGLAAILLFATFVAVALSDPDRRFLPGVDLRPIPVLGPIAAARRQIAWSLVVGALVLIAVVAVPFNLITVGDPGGDGVEVGDYRVTYAENVPDQSVANVPLIDAIPGVAGALSSVQASGVIVVNEKRNMWEEVVPAGLLAFRGHATVTVGGLGWRETVGVNRTAWTVVDGGSTYTVYIRRPGQGARRVFMADPVMVPSLLDGKRVRIRPTADGYVLDVTENATLLASVGMPTAGSRAQIAGLTFTREGRDLIASYDRTRIHIANLRLSERP